MDPLACEKIVFRALRKSWVNPGTGFVAATAFMLRESPKDDDGLSVGTISAEQSVTVLSTHAGCASLHVGKIRDIGLDVVPDEESHANITGIPRNDVARAEFLAGQLAKMARHIPVALNKAK